MSIINSNTFLFLIAIFSFYLAFAGMRFAKNRKGIATTIDWIAVSLMILSGLGMWALAITYFINDNSQYITLLVFGFIALALDTETIEATRIKQQQEKRELQSI